MTGYRSTDRRRRTRKGDRMRVVFVMVLLFMLEFYLRPAIFEPRHGTPDFLILVLLLLAIRRTPGVAAVIGFAIGLLIDVLTPARFGAGILANVLVGWGAAWGRSLFFADNLMVNAALFFVGTWTRDVLTLVFSGTPPSAMPVEALVWAPLQSLSTAVVGVVVVVVFRDWLAIRIEA